MIVRGASAASALSWAIAAAVLVIFFVGLFKVVAPFLEGLVWGLIWTLMTWPIYRWLHTKCRLPEVAAGLLMTVGAGMMLVLSVVPVATELGKELYSISKESTLSTWAGAEKLFSIPALDRAAQRLHIDDASALLIKTLGRFSLDITSMATQLFLEALVNIGMMIFSSYFFFLYGAKMLGELHGVLTHFSNLKWRRVFALTADTIRGVFYGAITTAFAQGLLAGVGFYSSGAPIPVLLGLVTTLMSFVPFGAPLVYVPISAYLALGEGDWFAGVGLLLWGVLVVSTIDNILRPLFISQTMRLPLLLVFVGVAGGIFAFGLIGLFIGPVLIALSYAAWRELVATSAGGGFAHHATPNKQ